MDSCCSRPQSSGGQAEVLVIIAMFALEFVQLIQVILQQRFAAKRPFAVRPPFGVHLQQPKINPQLNLFHAVLALKFPDDNLPGLIIPLIQQGRNIETHVINMDAAGRQVNALQYVRCSTLAPQLGQTWPMSALAHVAVHSSQFPENVQRDLLQSLRARRIDPKFHYASYKQSQKWLALHEAWSPSRIDADCAALYDRSFPAAAGALASSRRALDRAGLRRRTKGRPPPGFIDRAGEGNILHALRHQPGSRLDILPRRPKRRSGNTLPSAGLRPRQRR